MGERHGHRYDIPVHRVMDHVRGNLRGDLSLRSLAKLAGFSAYHFHRVFSTTTGQTLGDFVRRTRLERAAALMKAGPRRTLSTIALECGFAELSAFSRAFRERYGLAPSAWDRRSPLVPREPTVEPAAPSLSDLVERGARAGPVDVEVATWPALRLAYVRIAWPWRGDALRRGYARLYRWMERRGLLRSEPLLLGLGWDDFDVTPLGEVRYDFAFEVEEGVAASDGIGILELSETRVARAPGTGDLARVAYVWDHLYRTWLPRSRWDPADQPARERYRTWPDRTGWERWDLDCCLPVRPSRPG